MKKKIICLSLVIVAFIVSLIYFKKDSYLVIYEKNSINKNGMLSMNIEQTAGAGDYKQVSQSSWPSDGYVFNDELSSCENNSALSWDDTNKTVIFSGNLSDKCYAYFDILVITTEDVCSSGDTLTDCITKYGDKGSMASNIYIHNSSLANGAGDNSYRFAGPSETVNNFVCFGSTATPCPTDNLYRIIGLIDGKVKLIKYDYATSALLGTNGDYYNSGNPSSTYKGSLTSIDIFYWDYNANKSATNTWSTSLLNTTNLNTNFINNIGSTWSNKIAMTTWKVGGNISSMIDEVTPAEAYQNEIGNNSSSTTYESKIGLMYASDYYYSASPSAWTLVGYYPSDTSKDYSAATSINWMYMGVDEWTITRTSDSLSYAFNVDSIGRVMYDKRADLYDAIFYYGTRPVFSLESSVTYVSGSGTQSDPIIIN